MNPGAPFLNHFRRLMRDHMTSVCEIRVPDGTFTTNATTLEQTPGATVIASDVACDITPAARSHQTIAPGDSPLTERRYFIDMPVATDASRDCVIEITQCPDTGMVGRTFRVIDLPDNDNPVIRRAVCIDHLRGAA